MWTEAAWFPVVAIAVAWSGVVVAAGLISAAVTALSPRQIRIVGGIVICVLCASAVLGWTYALFLPPVVDISDPECLGPPYARC